MIFHKTKKEITKVLIIRFSSIGDIVLTTPVLRALKQCPEKALETHYVTKKAFAGILEHNPYADRLHLHDGKLSKLIRQLRKEHFDLIIDLHNSTRSNILTFNISRPTIAFKKLNTRKWILTNFKVNLLPPLHVVNRYMNTLRVFETLGDGMGLDYYFPDKMPAVEEFLPEFFHQGYIAFAIGGRHATKRLPNEKIVGILRKLEQPVVLLGDHHDENNGRIISEASGPNTLSMCGRLSLHESAWLIKHALTVVTHDTGLMHIAAAFNKPIVSIWGNTVPAFGMTPYMPRFPERSKIIEVTGLSCRPCSKLGYQQCPKKHFDCMMKMDEDRIAEEICRLADEQM